MKDSANIHLKVQELCDCFATTDPLKGMSDISRAPEGEEAALKWIALAALHGINSNAEKISLITTRDGNVKVTVEYRQGELPSPRSGRRQEHCRGDAGDDPYRKR